MRVQNPIVGKQSGRSGQLIFQSYYGRTYARRMPFSFHYPDTPAQQKVQAIFYDIQRNWTPIYQQIKGYYNKKQRANLNAFDVLSAAVYRILNAYHRFPVGNVQTDFGLDKLNRVRPLTSNTKIEIIQSSIKLSTDIQGVSSTIEFRPAFTLFILFNQTQQTLIFTRERYQVGTYEISLTNTLKWQPTDIVLAYVALTSHHWCSNFNLLRP